MNHNFTYLFVDYIYNLLSRPRSAVSRSVQISCMEETENLPAPTENVVCDRKSGRWRSCLPIGPSHSPLTVGSSVHRYICIITTTTYHNRRRLIPPEKAAQALHYILQLNQFVGYLIKESAQTIAFLSLPVPIGIRKVVSRATIEPAIRIEAF